MLLAERDAAVKSAQNALELAAKLHVAREHLREIVEAEGLKTQEGQYVKRGSRLYWVDSGGGVRSNACWERAPPAGRWTSGTRIRASSRCTTAVLQVTRRSP